MYTNQSTNAIPNYSLSRCRWRRRRKERKSWRCGNGWSWKTLDVKASLCMHNPAFNTTYNDYLNITWHITTATCVSKKVLAKKKQNQNNLLHTTPIVLLPALINIYWKEKEEENLNKYLKCKKPQPPRLVFMNHSEIKRRKKVSILARHKNALFCLKKCWLFLKSFWDINCAYIVLKMDFFPPFSSLCKT